MMRSKKDLIGFLAIRTNKGCKPYCKKDLKGFSYKVVNL